MYKTLSANNNGTQRIKQEALRALRVLRGFSIILLASIILTSKPAAAPSLEESNTLYKAEGAHFEVGLDQWLVAAELKTGNGEKYYFTFNFSRSGTLTLHYRHGMAGLYDAKKDEYSHLSFAPFVFAEAARRELLKGAETNPRDAQKLKEAAERISKREFRNFLALDEEPAVYRNRLFINHAKFHFKRTSDKKFTYSLLAPVGGAVVFLKMNSVEPPAVFDSKSPLIRAEKVQMQGYIFPLLKVEGAIEKGGAKTKVAGEGVYVHVFGNPSQAWNANYREFFLDLGAAGRFAAFVYLSSDGAPLGQRAALVKHDGSGKNVVDIVLKPGAKWKSAISRIEYPAETVIESNLIDGRIKILSKKTEEHLIEGRGAFFFGPCEFAGTVSGVKGEVNGRGFCRMVVPLR